MNYVYISFRFSLQKETKMQPLCSHQTKPASAHEHLVHAENETLSCSRHGSIAHITFLFQELLQYSLHALLCKEIKTHKEMVSMQLFYQNTPAIVLMYFSWQPSLDMQHRLQRIFPRKVSKRNNCPLVQSNSEVFSTALGSQLHLVNKFCATLLSLHTSFMWIIYLLVPLLKHQVAQQMPIYFPGSSDVAHTFPLVSFITACLQSRAKDLTQLQLKRAAKPILISARIGAG